MFYEVMKIKVVCSHNKAVVFLYPMANQDDRPDYKCIGLND